MRDHVVVEVDRDVGHVLVAVQVALSRGHQEFRFGLDQIIHDREIVGSKIPDHIDIVLEEPEIDPRGIVVVELA